MKPIYFRPCIGVVISPFINDDLPKAHLAEFGSFEGPYNQRNPAISPQMSCCKWCFFWGRMLLVRVVLDRGCPQFLRQNLVVCESDGFHLALAKLKTCHWK